jgi:hypothetical protein
MVRPHIVIRLESEYCARGRARRLQRCGRMRKPGSTFQKGCIVEAFLYSRVEIDVRLAISVQREYSVPGRASSRSMIDWQADSKRGPLQGTSRK